MSVNNVRRMALIDISKEIFTKYKKFGTVWISENIVTPSYLDTIETRKLNRRLGLTKINYLNNKNSIK